MAELIAYLKLHWVEIAAGLFLAYYAAKAVAKLTPTEADDTFLSKVGSLLNQAARMLRFDPPPDPFESQSPVAAVPVIRELATGILLPRDAPRGRPLLRTMVRRIAIRNGLDPSRLSDDQVDEVIAEATHGAGPIKDVLAWIFANPDKVLGILKILLAVFAEESPKAEDISV